MFGVAEIISGCGQKGPLVHPDAHTHKAVGGATAPAMPNAPASSPGFADSSIQRDDAKPDAAPPP